MPTAIEVADRLYDSWNAGCLSALCAVVDPAIQLISDPLQPDQTALSGLEGWQQWVDRWEQRYETMQVTPDAIVALDPEHVLALVSFTATPRGGCKQVSWAAAHIWTVRGGRIAGWETHVDFAAAQSTLHGS
jgi:ketosteroid isomerase-like protein